MPDLKAKNNRQNLTTRLSINAYFNRRTIPLKFDKLKHNNSGLFGDIYHPYTQARSVFLVNAAEAATNLELTSKIATVVNLFKSEFPEIKSDLKPWHNDPETRELIDPDSIDIGLHFPGRSKLFQSRSILIQIRFYQDPINGEVSCIGVEAAGFDHRGKQWRLSTVEDWRCEGETQPKPEASEQLKQFCRQIIELFNN